MRTISSPCRHVCLCECLIICCRCMTYRINVTGDEIRFLSNSYKCCAYHEIVKVVLHSKVCGDYFVMLWRRPIPENNATFRSMENLLLKSSLWASYQVRKIVGCACSGNVGNVFPATHVLWCMPGSLTSGFHWNRWRGKRSRHSRSIHNPKFCVPGKRPIEVANLLPCVKYTDSSLPIYNAIFILCGHRRSPSILHAYGKWTTVATSNKNALHIGNERLRSSRWVNARKT